MTKNRRRHLSYTAPFPPWDLLPKAEGKVSHRGLTDHLWNNLKNAVSVFEVCLFQLTVKPQKQINSILIKRSDVTPEFPCVQLRKGGMTSLWEGRQVRSLWRCRAPAGAQCRVMSSLPVFSEQEQQQCLTAPGSRPACTTLRRSRPAVAGVRSPPGRGPRAAGRGASLGQPGPTRPPLPAHSLEVPAAFPPSPRGRSRRRPRPAVPQPPGLVRFPANKAIPAAEPPPPRPR